MIELHYVEKPEHVLKSLATFNTEAPAHHKEAKGLMRSTSYWVYCPDKHLFGPGKFVGFQDMNFARYKRALDRDYEGNNFHGHNSMLAIENALSRSFAGNPPLWSALKRWGEGLLDPGVLDHLKNSKWQFVILAGQESRQALRARTERGAARLRYWFTTQDAPVEHTGSNAAVWVYPKYRDSANEMAEGDRVAIYETAKKGGCQAVVLLAKIGHKSTCPEPEKDEDGKEWLKIATVEPIAEDGKCLLRSTVGVLKPTLKTSDRRVLGRHLQHYGGRVSEIRRDQFERFGSHFRDYISPAAEIEKEALDAFEKADEEGQGFTSNSKIRRAVESYAVFKAREYLEAQGFTDIRDCSKKKSYDFTCVRYGEMHYVEVKGTQTNGSTVIVTANEAKHMRSVAHTAILFVVSSVRVAINKDGKPVASGGKECVLFPWRIADRALDPIAYRYSLPVDGE